MPSKETLTSLAMLKVNLDHGQDYLDYLRPFVLQVLFDHRPDPVTDQRVHDLIGTQFGLQIPNRTIQIVLRRLARSHALVREHGVYRIGGKLENPGLVSRKAEAERHIQAVVAGLIAFSADTPHVIASAEAAENALTTFLLDFNVSYLRAYLRGTAIPTPSTKDPAERVLVSRYVMYLKEHDLERFNSFMIMMQGHMLANALLCPDLQNAPRSYRAVTFFLDTPLLVQSLGLEGTPKEQAAQELIQILKRLDGTVATFSHSREELGRVVAGAAEFIERQDGRGAIVTDARRRGLSRSDLLLTVAKLDELLADSGIEIKRTPPYIDKFQIDEKVFGQILEDEVDYFNPRAREYDINSVRSVYVLRAHTTPASIEQCKAILVSSNMGFSRAAYEYGQRHDESKQVSSVTSDFSLANMAWLKAPMGAPSIPMTEVLAYSYAAVQPSAALLEKFLNEIDKLQNRGKISERDHQLLRSSMAAQDELVGLTLGDEKALTEETIAETLRRVSEEIKREENEKAENAAASQRRTRSDLDSTIAERDALRTGIYWRLRRRAIRWTNALSAIVVLFVIVGLLGSLGLKTQNALLGWILFSGLALVAVLSLANLLFGTTLAALRTRLERRLLRYLVSRESELIGVQVQEEPTAGLPS